MENNDQEIKTVGIVGYGNFSKVIIKLFNKIGFEVFVNSRRFVPGSDKAKLEEYGFRFTDIRKIFTCDLIIPSVPISIFESWLKSYAEQLKKCRKDQLLIEICSVNELPAKWMNKYVNQGPALISSHPLFGPSSSVEGTKFEGLRFLLHPIRIENNQAQNKFEFLIKSLGFQNLDVIDQSPAEHDRQMAYSQAVTFLFGKVGAELSLKETELSTPWFKKFLEIQHMVDSDSDQLFWDMFRYNPYARQMLSEVRELLQSIESQTQNLS